MPWGAAAVVGAAVIGASASKSASDKAANSAKKGMAASEATMNKARTDAINLFASGRASSQAGTGGALNFYQQNAQAKINPFIKGNIAAQQVLGQGATQTNNAILGLPVDMGFANNPQTIGADYSGITTAKMPTLGASYAEQQAALNATQAPLDAAAAAAAKKKAEDEKFTAGYILDPKNQVNNVKNFVKKIF